MGILSAKCDSCWDPIPCGCPAERERSGAVAAHRETWRLLEEQNRLQREQNELLRAQTDLLKRWAAR